MIKGLKKHIPFIKKFVNLPKYKFASSKAGEEEVVFETREEKELRYEDECFYFEREWNKFQQEKINKKQDYLSPDISEFQQRECDILVERMLKMSGLEKEYFEYALKEKFEKTTGIEPGKPNIFSLAKIPKISLSRDSDNPNWENSQRILTALTPFIASGYFTGGAGPAATGPTQAASKETIKEKEPEKVQVKARVDLKLSAFEAGKKINLIKEVRALLNLGLKEAKELVEKAPVVLKPNIPRAEAEELQKKLKEFGATIELV